MALRDLRVKLKTDAMGPTPELAEAIRAEIKRAELNAEHGEQIILSGVLEKLRQFGSEDALGAAEFNVRFYIESLGNPLQKPDLDGLRTIAGFAVRIDAVRA